MPETEDGSMEAALREPAEEPPSKPRATIEEPAEVADARVALAAPPADDPSAATDAPESATDGVRVDAAERAKRERVGEAHEARRPASRHRRSGARCGTAATTNPVTVRVAAGTNQNTVVRVSSGARFHVVQRGESLWSIATDRLGERAGVAQIAREVDRLWQLNEDRIASGSPDLLYTGTRLRLR